MSTCDECGKRIAKDLQSCRACYKTYLAKRKVLEAEALEALKEKRKMTLRAGRVRLRIDVAMKYEGASEIMRTIIDKAKENDVVIYTLALGDDWKK